MTASDEWRLWHLLEQVEGFAADLNAADSMAQRDAACRFFCRWLCTHDATTREILAGRFQTMTGCRIQFNKEGNG